MTALLDATRALEKFLSQVRLFYGQAPATGSRGRTNRLECRSTATSLSLSRIRWGFVIASAKRLDTSVANPARLSILARVPP